MGLNIFGVTIPENLDSFKVIENGVEKDIEEVVIFGISRWKKQKYYWIIYDANSGTGNMNTQTIPVGIPTALLPNTYTRLGYLFSGWSLNRVNKAYDNTQLVTDIVNAGQTLTLYALWNGITYYIDYYGNGATGGETARSTHTYDVNGVLSPNGYARTGYLFNGWMTGNGAVYANQQNVVNLSNTNGSVISLNAQWTPVTYYVQYNGNGADSGSMGNTTHTYDVSSVLSPNVYNKSYFSFIGWSTGGSTVQFANKATVTNLSNTNGSTVSLYAVWKPTAIANRSDGCLPVTGGICMGSSAGEYRDNAFWEGAGKFGWGYCPAEDSRVYWISTKAKVDLTNVRKIIFKLDTGSHCRLVCGASENSGLDGYTAAFYDADHKSGDRTIEVDVSGLTGSYYVKSQSTAYFSNGYASHFMWNYVTLE